MSGSRQKSSGLKISSPETKPGSLQGVWLTPGRDSLIRWKYSKKPQEKIKPEFNFLMARTPGRFLAEAEDLVIGYDSPLTRPVSFSIERGEKIAVTGTNGLGKTTLLRTILGEIPPYKGRISKGDYLFPGYFCQEAGRDLEQTALEYFWEQFPAMENREVRLCLAKCGLTNEHITSQMRVLSGGENAKVRLAVIMNREHNWLILDEPTNHLDQDAKKRAQKSSCRISRLSAPRLP